MQCSHVVCCLSSSHATLAMSILDLKKISLQWCIQHGHNLNLEFASLIAAYPVVPSGAGIFLQQTNVIKKINT